MTLVTALISALTNVSICNDLAMTGEITLRGRVLPVGGIKEKILAAVAAGMKRVLIPAENEKDLQDIPPELRRKIQVRLVERIDDVWPLACGGEPGQPAPEPEAAAKGNAQPA